MFEKYLNLFFSQKLLVVVLISIIVSCKNEGQINLERFHDSAHHWYDIHDGKQVINPLPENPKYDISEIRNIADNILLFQKDNGGWAKNYDMQAILTSEQIVKVKESKSVLNTTFDNGATHSQLSYLAEVYSITKEENYKNAFLKGIDFILNTQYDNGGWPQFSLDTSGYRKYITFNDGAMGGVIELLYNIVYKKSSYTFMDEEYMLKIQKAFEKGIQCILDCQIFENGKMSVWCQQHDNIDFKPQNARTFEPAAICNMESAEIVLFLMKLDNPNERIKSSINAAVEWFQESALSGIKVKWVNAPKEEFIYHTTDRDKIVVKDSDAPRIWTRFYELGTHVPMFCRRDGRIVYSMEEVERERRTGYAWYHYAPEEVLSKYPEWLKKYD